MLLHIQKPGLTHAATAHDWCYWFGRTPKKGARPLLVLRAQGPVDFVFDIQDTKGRELPVDAFSFPTFGELSDAKLSAFMDAIAKRRSIWSRSMPAMVAPGGSVFSPAHRTARV
jgi:hypothetical protein